MKTSKFKTRLLLKALSAILLTGLSTCLLTGCPQKAPKPVYYAVTLEDAGGKITANPALQEGKALKDSVIIFTASPADSVSHEVDKWEVTGGTKISGGEDESSSVKVKITADTKIKVTFKEKPKYTVTFTKPADGSLTASDSIASGASVYKGTVITFTAESDTPVSHETDTWVVTGGTKISGGEPGDPIVRVKITADTKIKVTFKEKPKYTVSIIPPSDGTLTTETDISGKVYKGTEIIFTAAPTNSSTHEVDKWEVSGGQILEGSTAGSTSVKVKITADTTVKITFRIPFVQIPKASIVGKNPTYSLPGNEDWWKGVFIGGRTVHLSAYALSKTEVPYWLWKEVYDWAVTKGYKFANVGREGSAGTDGAPPTEAGRNEPVTRVSWRDCIVWCNAYTEKEKGIVECVYRKSESDPTVLNDATDETACDSAYFDKSKKGYRLPTEAEWEYAARRQGTDETNAEKYGDVWLTKLWSGSGMKKPIGFKDLPLPEGESWTSLRDELSRIAVCDQWYNGSSWVDQTPSTTKTASVGSKEANALGLHDMSGNVWEWCWDWYCAIRAVEETDPVGAASGSDRMIRGGSWGIRAASCTVGFRNNISPDRRNSFFGFRLAFRP